MVGAGDRLGSNYMLGPVLGRGSMGVVNEAHSLSSGERVAVKILHPHLAADVAIVGRFIQERQVLERVNHANVVGVRDLVVDRGYLGIVMEHVEGVDLKQVLASRSLTATEAVGLAEQLAGGLHEIHTAGIVHRDLKPGNVLVASGDEMVPKISDFGISHLADNGQVVKAFAGTPRYVAPEALTEGNTVGPAFDVYTLGLVLYEMLIGSPPFTVEGSVAAMLAHREAMPPSVGGVPSALTDLIDRMLDKRPQARPTADAVYTDLATLVWIIDPAEEPYPVEPKARRPSSKPSVAAGAATSRAKLNVETNGQEAKPVSAFVALAREAERRRRTTGPEPVKGVTVPRPPPSTFAALARKQAERARRESGEPESFDIIAGTTASIAAPPTAPTPAPIAAVGTTATPAPIPAPPPAATPPAGTAPIPTPTPAPPAATPPAGTASIPTPAPAPPAATPPAGTASIPTPAPAPPATSTPTPGAAPAPAPPATTAPVPTEAPAAAAAAVAPSATPSIWASWSRAAATMARSVAGRMPDIRVRQVVTATVGAGVVLVAFGVLAAVVARSSEEPTYTLLAADTEPPGPSTVDQGGGRPSDDRGDRSPAVEASESNRGEADDAGRSSYLQAIDPTLGGAAPSLPSSLPPVAVPPLAGRSVADAEAALEDLGLVAVVVDGSGGPARGGQVTRSVPASGVFVDPGTEVTVWATTG